MVVPSSVFNDSRTGGVGMPVHNLDVALWGVHAHAKQFTWLTVHPTGAQVAHLT